MIDVKNQADSLVYSLEKLLRENKERVPEGEAAKVRLEIDNTKKAIESENADRIKEAMEALTRASHKLTEMMYQQAGPQAQAGGPQGQAGTKSGDDGSARADEEVIDAEVVDEDKKN